MTYLEHQQAPARNSILGVRGHDRALGLGGKTPGPKAERRFPNRLWTPHHTASGPAPRASRLQPYSLKSVKTSTILRPA